MKKILLLILVFCYLFTGCSKKTEENKNKEPENKSAMGGRIYGGVFKVNETSYFKNLFPHNIIDVYAHRIANQVYEGFFKYNQEDLSLKPCLIETYSVDSTGKIFVFKIKRGVLFHDDPCFPNGKGRELKAQDFKFCFDLLCTKDINNQGFSGTFKNRVLGASNYYDTGKSENGVDGIRVIDDYTLQIELEKPYSPFLNILASPFTYVFPKEAIVKYGAAGMRAKAVGTGPYILKSIDEDISVILSKNAKYHGVDVYGNKLPFLDAIKISFIKDQKTELFEFKKGNLDMIYKLPTEHIIDILSSENSMLQGEYKKYKLQRNPEMSVFFYDFLCVGKVFSNRKIRQAFSYAVDRRKIVDFVLNGSAFEAGSHGITPPTFKGYEADKINGYAFDPEKARQLLSEAGYSGGKGFPKVVLDIDEGGGIHKRVAEEIQKQWKEILNIHLDMNFVSFAQKVEKVSMGNYDIARQGWIADFPSPENFLWLFYGKDVPQKINEISYPNSSRYANSEFDKLYEAALVAPNIQDSYRLFMKAENIAMADAPVLVLWYDESYRILQQYVLNFPNNPMQYRDFSEVYFSKSDTTQAVASVK